jgi:hypothetical protein
MGKWFSIMKWRCRNIYSVKKRLHAAAESVAVIVSPYKPEISTETKYQLPAIAASKDFRLHFLK